MIVKLSRYSLEYKARGGNDTRRKVTTSKNKDYKLIRKKWRGSLLVSSLLLLRHKKDTPSKEKGFLLLLGAALFFYISAAMIFGPYTPFLKENGITDAEVFIATAVLHISKIALLPFNNQFVNRLGGEVKASSWSYWPRIVGIGIMIIAAVLLAGNSTLLMVASMISFIALQIGFTMWHTTTSSLLFGRVMTLSKIDSPDATDNKGKMLGISSSVTGGGALMGSLCVGEIVARYGYGMTFGISGIFLMISLLLIMRYRTKQGAGNSIKQLHREQDGVAQKR
jgi:predicted MFS family arabinose efflux permease